MPAKDTYHAIVRQALINDGWKITHDPYTMEFGEGVDRQMERLNEYRRIIRELIQHYAQFKPAKGNVETEIIFDESNDHYELIHNGWNGIYHIHGSILHIDIRNGKVWIQHDGTADGIASELVEAGIPREHIVLAFKPPEARPLTDYAVA